MSRCRFFFGSLKKLLTSTNNAMSTINRHDAATRLPYTSRLDPSQIMHMTLNTIIGVV